MFRHGGPEPLPPGTDISTPSTLAELQALLPQKPIIRARAAGHSGVPWGAPSYVNVSAFNRPLAITADTVTCEAGVMIVDLLAFLATRARNIEGLPSILHATIGGVILTGGHGSGVSVLASQVLNAVFVLGDGRLLTIPATDPNFPATITSAGMVGILYSVTLRTVPAATLYQQRTYTKLPLDPIGWLRSGLYRQFFYNPYTQHALLYDHSSEQPFGGDHEPLVGKWLKNKNGEKLAVRIYENFAWLVPRFIDLTYQALAGRSSGPVAEVLSIPEYNVPYLDYEVAVPVEQAPQALAQLHELVMKWKEEHQYYLWFGIMLRHLPRDTYPLSMAYGSDVVAFALPLFDNEQSREFVEEVQKLLGTRYHVGKYFPGSVTEHHGWQAFEPLRTLLDPSGRFMPQYSLPPSEVKM
jgi:FAD/FMN-containing dehydrogenase